MKKTLCLIISVILISGAVNTFSPCFAADETLCREITKECNITLNETTISDGLTDGSEESYEAYDNAEIIIDSAVPVGGIYIKFDRTPPVWTMSYGESSVACGKNGFLHEYQSINDDNVLSLTLSFSSPVSFADIYVLSRGDKLPGFVQTWRPAEGRCDIMLLACHSDDDQLFFAGSVPDAVNRGAEMQVCYFTNHWRKSHKRPHELLNGLWTCGLDRYPVIGFLPDIKRADTEEEMLKIFEEEGFNYAQMVAYQVMLLRKYKPQIVLVHDINGEYGHGAHRLDSHSLRDAAKVSGDPSEFIASYVEYGVWDVPKVYIHLYDKNTIDFEIDTPLQRFGGKTAYQVSQDAFKCHKSQYGTRYKEWLIGTDEEPVTDSSGFPKYSPRQYGLWKTSVGFDVIKKDFYENIVLLNGQGSTVISTPETTEEEAETTADAETDTPETTDEITKPVEKTSDTQADIPETTAKESETVKPPAPVTTTAEADDTVAETENSVTVSPVSTESDEETEDETTIYVTDTETAIQTEISGGTETVTDTYENDNFLSKEKKNGIYTVAVCSVGVLIFAVVVFAIVNAVIRKNKKSL